MDMLHRIEFLVTLSLMIAGSVFLNFTRLKFKEDPEYYASRFFLVASSHWYVVLLVMFWAALATCVATMALYEDIWVHHHMCLVASMLYALAFGLSARIVSNERPAIMSARGV